MNKIVIDKIKMMLLNSIELNCIETKSIEEANWNNGNAHATMVAVIDMLDLLDTEEQND